MRELTWRQIAVIAGGILAVGTLAIGLYGLVKGPERTAAATTPSVQPTDTLAPAPFTASTDAATPSGKPLLRTADPLEYARAVAVSLLTWDTADGYLPTDYTADVLADADPSGEETAGLISDVALYLPTIEQWLGLGVLGTRQTIEIDGAYIPEAWRTAVEQAHGQLRPGTTAVTVTGTRRRTGVWKGKHAATSSRVSFTVFVACAPAFGRCHVLRLSLLNKPLR